MTNLSENIQLVFDNEESFINWFKKNDITEEIMNFYMGSAHHLVKSRLSNGCTEDSFIDSYKFETWKQSLNKDDSNEQA